MRLSVGLLFVCCFMVEVHAQVPHIVGTWELNIDKSTIPEPAPQREVRRYLLNEDGVLIGVAVFIDADGNPGFLQFAAKPDGTDYPEFDTWSAAQYLMDGTEPARTYSETPVDSHTVEWVDKHDGRIIASGRKWVSDDGQTLSFTVRAMDEQGEKVENLYVYDRTGP